MSLGVCIKGPEGIVLAAESRLTLEARSSQGQTIHVNYDHATKLLSFAKPHQSIGVLTYGLAAIDGRTPQSYVPEFESELGSKVLKVEDFARRVSEFFMARWGESQLAAAGYSGPPLTLVTAGFDKEGPYGRVFVCDIPNSPIPEERNPDAEFGVTWGGQSEMVDRLLLGYDRRMLELATRVFSPDEALRKEFAERMAELALPVPIQAMPLQDCVDLALFFLETTIDAQRLTVGVRGCGGPIDLAVITRRNGLKWVQQKTIHGQIGYSATSNQIDGERSEQ